jgi:maltose-binding protein MalE
VHGPATGIQPNIPKYNDLWSKADLITSTAQNGTHPGNEFRRMKRFGKIIVGSGF